MEDLTNFTMNKEQVKESPKDCVLDGVITKIEKGTLKDCLSKDIDLTKWSNLDQPTLLIHFETKFEGSNIGGTDRLAYYDEPMSGSKLGKFLTKYEVLEVGQKIKIDFDGEGFSSIKLK